MAPVYSSKSADVLPKRVPPVSSPWSAQPNYIHFLPLTSTTTILTKLDVSSPSVVHVPSGAGDGGSRLLKEVYGDPAQVGVTWHHAPYLGQEADTPPSRACPNPLTGLCPTSKQKFEGQILLRKNFNLPCRDGVRFIPLFPSPSASDDSDSFLVLAVHLGPRLPEGSTSSSGPVCIALDLPLPEDRGVVPTTLPRGWSGKPGKEHASPAG